MAMASSLGGAPRLPSLLTAVPKPVRVLNEHVERYLTIDHHGGVFVDADPRGLCSPWHPS
jgi:hypothetical protein